MSATAFLNGTRMTERNISAPRREWEKVQDLMRNILNHMGIQFTEAGRRSGFLYGPKLDIQIKNVHGKEDTLITIQIDFQLASRFNMEYTDSDGQKKFPLYHPPHIDRML